MLGSAKLEFEGEIVRIEPDGFGVVRFDKAIGPKANTHGVFSPSQEGADIPYERIKPGMHVSGQVVVQDDRELGSIQKIEVPLQD